MTAVATRTYGTVRYVPGRWIVQAEPHVLLMMKRVFERIRKNAFGVVELAEGLDGLQGSCRTVVFGELDWSPGVHEQCIGRIHRDGQAEHVTAYFLTSEFGADPIMAEVLGVKREQVEGIRTPHGDLLETLETEPGHVRRLAESFLARQRRGGASGVPTSKAGE